MITNCMNDKSHGYGLIFEFDKEKSLYKVSNKIIPLFDKYLIKNN